MIKLAIITINYNDAEGLRKTLASVAMQTYPHIQHIIVDGGSTDGSVEIIREYADNQVKGERLEAKGTEDSKTYSENNPTPIYTTLHNSTLQHDSTPPKHHVLWVSEPDKGIYNAMNKGIEIALGKRIVNSFNRSELVEDKNKGLIASNEYIQILNAGDILASADVTERMFSAMSDFINSSVCIDSCRSRDVDSSEMLSKLSSKNITAENSVDILYGNMLKVNSRSELVGKSGYTEYSLRQFYSSTLNHDCAYIRKDLFEEYGLYDENLKIVSDWKWYLQAIGLGRVKPEYVDIDVTLFDDGGISETNLELRNKERRQVLEELLPPAVLWDYDQHAFEMEQMNRLRRWKLYPIVYFMERVCFKFEKWGILKR